MINFIFRGTDYVKAAFTQALRSAFSIQPFFPVYKYTNDLTSKLSIFSVFPNRVLKVPTIIVSSEGGDLDRTTLDTEDLLKEDVSQTETVTGWGKFNIGIKLTILSTAERDRNKLTDLTALFCRHLFVNKFASFGIGYSRVTIQGENTIDWQNQVLYTNSIQIPCYTEFQINYPVELVDVINNLSISVNSEI